MTTKMVEVVDNSVSSRIARRLATTPLVAVLIALTLAIAGLVLAIQNDRLGRAEKLRQVTVQSQILAASVAAPLAFDDHAASQEYLNALRASPEIRAAGAYDATGKLVAGFHLPGTALPRIIHLMPSSISGRDLIVTTKVMQGDTALGAVYLRTSLESWPRRAMRYLGIALIVLMASLVIAVLGASYASLRDAHNSLRAEIRNRQQAEEALRQSQKMEAMGQLTGGVAHDFNNLLMVASSGLDLMERTTDPAKIERLKTGIRQAVDRGAKLTQQLLAFARRSPLHPEVIDLGERIRGMDALLDRSLGEGVTVEVMIDPDLWPVEVDPSQLEVAVLNVALNARDAMPNGGSITITVKNVRGANGKMDQVCLSIKDVGTGIAPDMIDKVFEPFFTTKGVGHGTGLGLSQVYGFAHASGGELQVDSEVGKGTMMSLLIPRSMQAPPSQANAQQPITVSDTARRILLVEDDDNVATMVRDMLTELGYESERAVSADAAIQYLANDAGFELVLSDMVMPGKLSGLDLVRIIARQWPKLSTVLMTGYSEAASSASDEGISLLIKPYSMEDLARQIDASLSTMAHTTNTSNT